MERVRVLNVTKYAGAYIAFEIGSGFATGQEILQFYSSYGLWSIGAAVISMILFAWVGGSIIKLGFETKNEERLKPYRLICGNAMGRIYEIFVTFYLFAGLSVMLSGAGASLSEYYGIPYYVGGLCMALLTFVSFVFGLRKLIDVVGLMGPVIIGVTIFVAVWTIAENWSELTQAGEMAQTIETKRPAEHWWMSGILYVAYNIVSSIAFLMALGKDAASGKEAMAGGIAGGIALMITVIFMDLALLSKLPASAKSIVPSLQLAKDISPEMGTVFVGILVLGIFSTAAPMLWTICSNLARQGSFSSKLIALLVSMDALVLGQLPFDKLVAVIYPLSGYLGILLLACIVVFRIRGHKKR